MYPKIEIFVDKFVVHWIDPLIRLLMDKEDAIEWCLNNYNVYYCIYYCTMGLYCLGYLDHAVVYENFFKKIYKSDIFDHSMMRRVDRNCFELFYHRDNIVRHASLSDYRYLYNGLTNFLLFIREVNFVIDHDSDNENHNQRQTIGFHDNYKLKKILHDRVNQEILETRQFRNLSLLRECNYCDKKKKQLFTCKRCRMVYYCSKICQKKDWNLKGHKDQCKELLDALERDNDL